jgi:hypothetical protein
MADLILNEALGFSRQLIQNVEDNSPAAAVLRIHAWDGTGSTDETIRDVTDGNVDDIEAVASVAEVTNGGYANIPMDETDITIVVDDTNNRVDITLVDQTFSSILAGDAWTDITLSYDSLGTDVDTGVKVLWWLDFVVTPNGGDITVDFPAVSFRVSQV